LTEKLENKAIIIIGAGHFGQRAAALLKAVPHASLWIVERDIPTLKKLGTMGAKRIAEDGVRFLAKHFSHLAPSTFITCRPVHLAFEWLRTYMNRKGTVAAVPVPKSFGLRLPRGTAARLIAGQLC
jgi:D-arabinose 1-dehydrogenase-like Zn-dependent alcohol dehydrogenase